MRDRLDFQFIRSFSSSAGVSARKSAPAFTRFSRLRKPHVTPQAFKPALCPVRMSTSLSPTISVSSGRAFSFSRIPRATPGSGFTGVPGRFPRITSKIPGK